MENKLASRLKFLRKKHGISLKKLSQLVDIKFSTLKSYEYGLRDITSDNLIILAKFFDVSTNYLLGLED